MFNSIYQSWINGIILFYFWCCSCFINDEMKCHVNHSSVRLFVCLTDPSMCNKNELNHSHLSFRRCNREWKKFNFVHGSLSTTIHKMIKNSTQRETFQLTIDSPFFFGLQLIFIFISVSSLLLQFQLYYVELQWICRVRKFNGQSDRHEYHHSNFSL